MKMRALFLAVLLVAPGGVFAHGEKHDDHSKTPMADAEVRKVDMDTKKITLKHGEIKNLDMPSMTMVFQVRDPALLEKVKAGDKVKFSAEKINGAFTVTAIEAVK